MDQLNFRPVVLIAGLPALTGALCDAIARNGFQAIGPFPSTAEVLSWSERWTPAIAILNSTSEEGSTNELATLLRRDGVLVLVHYEVGVCSKSSADDMKWQSLTRKNPHKCASNSNSEMERM